MYTSVNIIDSRIEPFSANLTVSWNRSLSFAPKEYAATGLLPLARVLYADEFWNRQVEQIYVEDANNVILYPRMGNHKIVLGNTDQVGDKLARMLLFYKKGLPQAGWNRYESINLAYEGQIVCKKRKDKK